MVKKSFALMELIITIVIVGILATIAVPIYRNTIEDAEAKVCQANLKVLDAALNIYVMENDAMPGDLSNLSPAILKKAYAQVMRQEDAWKMRLAYMIVGWQERGLAYAGLLHDLARGDINSITCPADRTPPKEGGVSYGLNAVLHNMRTQDFKALPNNTMLIGDNEAASFNDSSSFAARHTHVLSILNKDEYAQAITKDKQIQVVVGNQTGRTPNPPTTDEGAGVN
ncbi:MAG: hypothetical protein PHY94_07435, partial [Candidatus Omnitrophica bacterium]|nr:hypothetical protein [Candidatus Omnitrophota bacterium]